MSGNYAKLVMLYINLTNALVKYKLVGVEYTITMSASKAQCSQSDTDLTDYDRRSLSISEVYGPNKPHQLRIEADDGTVWHGRELNGSSNRSFINGHTTLFVGNSGDRVTVSIDERDGEGGYTEHTKKYEIIEVKVDAE
jgi:hypothetical protein